LPTRRQTRLVNASARAERDARIFALMQLGWTYDAIAEREGVSRERVRQIVNEALSRRGGEPDAEHRRLQLARLDPALRLAAEKVAAGDLRAVDKLIRVINQIDKYRVAAARRVGFVGESGDSEESEEEARERILRILSAPIDPDEELALDEAALAEEYDGEENPRLLLLRKLAEVDARRAAAAAAAAEEAAKAATGGPDAPADDSVSKFFAR
jgi:hypothetical protein